MLEVFDNYSIHPILRIRRRDCVPSVELRRHPCLTSTSALLMQNRLRWFGHAARRPEGDLIKGLLLSTPPAEDVGNHDQGRPVTPLRTTSIRPRTMEKELGEIGGANKYWSSNLFSYNEWKTGIHYRIRILGLFIQFTHPIV